MFNTVSKPLVAHLSSASADLSLLQISKHRSLMAPVLLYLLLLYLYTAL